MSAVLDQRRANFPGGPEGRALIDVIPTAPGSQAPGQAVITSATGPAPQSVRVEIGAPHETSFVVWQKGPGDADYKQVADVLSNSHFGPERGIYPASWSGTLNAFGLFPALLAVES